MATVTCTINGQKGRGGTSYGTAAAYMGRASNGTNYDYVLSFTTGQFSGKSMNIKFEIKMSGAFSGTKTYRWALLSSDANAIGASTTTNLYYNTYNDVTDPNQLEKGTVDWPDVNKDTHKVLTVTTAALKANTNYFLVLWPSSSAGSQVTVSATQYHNPVVLEYDPVSDLLIRHYLCNEAGRTMYSTDSMTVEAGSNHVPETITPPESHTASGAVFFAYGSESGINLGSGIADVDSFPANESAVVEINYPLAPGSIVVNVDGELWLAEVYYKE